jgi:hypothetical protein
MGNEMKDYIVGPMPATDFLDEFFPKTLLQTTCKTKNFGQGCFHTVVSRTSEVEAYKPFVGFLGYDHHFPINNWGSLGAAGQSRCRICN